MLTPWLRHGQIHFYLSIYLPSCFSSRILRQFCVIKATLHKIKQTLRYKTSSSWVSFLFYSREMSSGRLCYCRGYWEHSTWLRHWWEGHHPSQADVLTNSLANPWLLPLLWDSRCFLSLSKALWRQISLLPVKPALKFHTLLSHLTLF